MPDTSVQPRFQSAGEEDNFFMSLCNLLDNDEHEPPLKADSRDRDKWLHDFVRREPHLGGVLTSTTSIDVNRGWRVVGGRNQVARITQMLHDYSAAPGLSGWRPSFAMQSSAYRCSNMGSITELGKPFKDGPVTALYTVDPTRCKLQNNDDYPLAYYPGRNGKRQVWGRDDFFRVASHPDYLEEYGGLSFCCVERCIQIAKLMIAVFRHDEEQLGARAPRGLLLLSGITRDQWLKAMEHRDMALDSDRVKYYGAIAVLASVSAHVDAKLLALSQLPVSFNLRDWMDMTLYAYSLCFGYDPSEFWPVQYGALGRGNETQIQHEKATGKGRLDFVLGYQEQIQNFLPATIDFGFDQRDEQGDLLHAQIFGAWATAVKTAYEAGNTSTEGSLLSRAEGRIIMGNASQIPSSWTETPDVASTDEVSADNDPTVDPDAAPGSDTGATVIKNPSAASPTAQSIIKEYVNHYSPDLRRKQLMEVPAVRLAAEKFSTEPIVEYEYSNMFPNGRLSTLWECGEDLIKVKQWNGVGGLSNGK